MRWGNITLALPQASFHPIRQPRLEDRYEGPLFLRRHATNRPDRQFHRSLLHHGTTNWVGCRVFELGRLCSCLIQATFDAAVADSEPAQVAENEGLIDIVSKNLCIDI